MSSHLLRPARNGGSAAPVLVVTGASAGIGRATAVAFARLGWRVALLARGHAGLEGARRDVEAAGGAALVIPLDVADGAAVSAAADQVVAQWGRLDVWVNNAMATVFGPAERVLPEEWRRVTEVTYHGAVHGTLAALRHMREADGGTIVQVGSALAYRSIPLQAPYCAAKAALRGFTDSLRCELLHDRSGVRLTMVQLPGVNTPQFSWSRTHMPRRHRPVGKIFEPEAAARQIVRAALHAPREFWVGMPAIGAILGTMVAPGLFDRYLARSAYEAQMSLEPAGDGTSILNHPAGDDAGVRGPFEDEAKPQVLGISAALARAASALLVTGMASRLAIALARRRAHTTSPPLRS
ncbi:SDR family oxidoreductase [Sabulicella rubraurantiaca]|uniref:SDR family oxidoreductase n=1 Tax=Sabulicella rubraurantiaca TaxID=2811429 RepID=UPI001A975EE7|nr:SDR family oxidoreductase [Sabulicella rubraurantiaca]